MNDTEIIKALECCSTTREIDNGPCHQCPCYDENAGWCNDLPYAEVLALINRQKAEIEKLKAEYYEYPVKTVVGNNSIVCSKTSEDYDNLIQDISNAVAKDFIKANESCCQDLEINLTERRTGCFSSLYRGGNDGGVRMTCKDCLHYEVCNYYIDEETSMTVAECRYFSNRSEWVKLPCKVGDTLYQCDAAGRIYEITVTGIIYNTSAVAFDERAIGKLVFLTKEEAEKSGKGA